MAVLCKKTFRHFRAHRFQTEHTVTPPTGSCCSCKNITPRKDTILQIAMMKLELPSSHLPLPRSWGKRATCTNNQQMSRNYQTPCTNHHETTRTKGLVPCSLVVFVQMSGTMGIALHPVQKAPLMDGPLLPHYFKEARLRFFF